MSENALKAEIRETSGKGPLRRLRAQGIIPGVIYGKGASTPVSLNAKTLEALLKRARNQLLTLEVAPKEAQGKSGERMVLIKEVQRHPLKDCPVHVDFLEVSMDKKQRVKVPLHFVGTSKGVKLGGILNYVRRELEIECLPRDIPETIEVDISELGEGESIHVKDLNIREGVRPLNNPMDVLVAVVKAEEEKAPAEEAVEAVEAAPEKKEEAPKE